MITNDASTHAFSLSCPFPTHAHLPGQPTAHAELHTVKTFAYAKWIFTLEFT